MATTDNTYIAFTVFVPVTHSQDVAEVLRTLTNTEPAIVSKPGLKVDKVITYLPLDADIESLRLSLKDLFPSSYRMQTKTIEERDWRDKWKEHFHPFKITKHIKIVPSWHVAKKRSRFIEITLDPGYAFGTGLHETTQFVARMIERKRRRAHTLLDIGFGSGILSIVAAKLDYRDICAIDNDENAITAAMENAKKNFVHDIITFTSADLGSFSTNKQYDFIAANLDTTTLFNFSLLLIKKMHKRSYLCISGITLENRKAVHNHYKKQGLRCIKKYIGKEWCGFLYKKKKNGKISRLNPLKRRKKRRSVVH
ncbi:MAG: 50S ribosomal protein L11 methyltransferase [Candidatus Omnitrophica bacterium]|nr:50S ribosomal protein L11 methyltransferase [Candidatus Omnitrophota bacterium]